MRFAVVAAVVFGCTISPIKAHAETSSQTVAATQSGQFSPSHLAAARSFLQAYFIDSGAIETGAKASVGTLAVSWREMLSPQPHFKRMTNAQQQAVFSYLDTLGDKMTAAALRVAPSVLEKYAPKLAAIFTEGELGDFIAFVQSSQGKSIADQAVKQGVSDAAANRTAPSPTNYTVQQESAVSRFEKTPGGQRLQSHSSEFMSIVEDANTEITTTFAPGFRASMAHDLCALMEKQCPPALRAAGSGTP